MPFLSQQAWASYLYNTSSWFFTKTTLYAQLDRLSPSICLSGHPVLFEGWSCRLVSQYGSITPFCLSSWYRCSYWTLFWYPVFDSSLPPSLSLLTFRHPNLNHIQTLLEGPLCRFWRSLYVHLLFYASCFALVSVLSVRLASFHR